jgi:FkbM family methyltransferase
MRRLRQRLAKWLAPGIGSELEPHIIREINNRIAAAVAEVAQRIEAVGWSETIAAVNQQLENLQNHQLSLYEQMSNPDEILRILHSIEERLALIDELTAFDIHRLRDTRIREHNVANIRSRAMTVPTANGRVLCRSLGRYKTFVDHTDIGFGAHLMLDGFWEIDVTELVARNVGAGMTVLDLGAHIGYYTLLMADLVGPEGRVLAFEPNPASARNLHDNVWLNGFGARTTIRREAIWSRSGETVHFRVFGAEPKNAAIVPAHWANAPHETETDIHVPTFALDNLSDSVDFAKVDIEGAEEQLWQGSQGFFARNPQITLLLEFNCGRCVDAAGTLRQIERQFPLRMMNTSSRVVPVTMDKMIGTNNDWLLVLSHKNSEEI